MRCTTCYDKHVGFIDSDGFIPVSVDCDGSEDVLIGFASVLMIVACTSWGLLASREFVSDDKLEQVCSLFESQEQRFGNISHHVQTSSSTGYHCLRILVIGSSVG